MFVSWFKYKKALDERDKWENKCIDLLRVFNTYRREQESFSFHQSKEAKWIEKNTDIICSHCKSVFSDEIYYMCRRHNRKETMLFCPNCGAKMNTDNNRNEKDEY